MRSSPDMQLSTLTKLSPPSTSLILIMKDLELASLSRNVSFIKCSLSLIVIVGEKGIKEGSWDSIHVVRVAFE